MEYNHGQEIALNEMRMAAKAVAHRLAGATAAGVGTLLLLVLAGPQNLLGNLAQYLYATLMFEVRKLPIFGVREEDIEAVLNAWSNLYGQRVYWWVSIGIGVVVGGVVFGIMTWVFFRRGERAKLEQVIRGNALVTPKVHNKIMKRDYGKKPPFEMGKPLKLGRDGLLVPEALQYLHFAFAGASGSGKSTAIEEIIRQARERGDKGFVIDLNGAFFAKYGRPGDHILSLRDTRTEAWDFWCEPFAKPENLAEAMIEAGSDHQSFFWKGARAILASLLKNSKTVPELWESFQKSTSELREMLEKTGDISRRVMGDKDGDQADGIIGTTVLDFAFLKELNQWNDSKKKFSVTQWMNDNRDHSWTWVLVTDADVAASRLLLRVWFDLACLAALQRDPLNHNNLHTWLIIDELKSVGQLPSLPAILDKGRKYSTSVVLGFQAISQVRRIYGEDDARSIMNGLQNHVFFRMSEAESAEYVSQDMGEHDVEQPSFGMTFGPMDSSDRGSVNRSRVKKKIVLADEVRSLKTLDAFVKLSGHNPLRAGFSLANVLRKYQPAESRIRGEGTQPNEAKAPPRTVSEGEADSPSDSITKTWLPGVPQGGEA